MDLVLENIVKYRKEKGFSHEVMANLLEIAQPTYYKIESGKTELSIRRLYQIAIALEIGVERLLGIDAKQFHFVTFAQGFSQMSAKRGDRTS